MPYSEYSRIVQGWRKANIKRVTSSLIINQYLLVIYEIILICFSNIDIAWAQLMFYYIWWWFTQNLLMHFHESFFLITFSCHHVSLFRWMIAFYNLVASKTTLVNITSRCSERINRYCIISNVKDVDRNSSYP